MASLQQKTLLKVAFKQSILSRCTRARWGTEDDIPAGQTRWLPALDRTKDLNCPQNQRVLKAF
jgi:hypothetical protein